jgi:YebC/PmpR family DNA-binding regulatory protein
MSGHSKWSTIKRAKGAADVVKGRVFTIAARAITIAVIEGGGVSNPDDNFRLRLAVEKASQMNVPKENIQRAIDKGKGVGADAIQKVMYEAYGPGGVAILIEAATDNKQRTVAVVKNVLTQAGSALAAPGAVAYLFDRSGILTVSKLAHGYDAILEAALEAGADDVVDTSDMIEIYTTVPSLLSVKQQLQDKGIGIDNTEIMMRPKMPVSFDAEKITQIEDLIEKLEAIDDVQMVSTNIGA